MVQAQIGPMLDASVTSTTLAEIHFSEVWEVVRTCLKDEKGSRDSLLVYENRWVIPK